MVPPAYYSTLTGVGCWIRVCRKKWRLWMHYAKSTIETMDASDIRSVSECLNNFRLSSTQLCDMAHRSPVQFRQVAGCWYAIFMYTLQLCTLVQCGLLGARSLLFHLSFVTIWVSVYSLFEIPGSKTMWEWMVNNLLCTSDLLLHSFAETSKQEQCILITTCKRIKLYPCTNTRTMSKRLFWFIHEPFYAILFLLVVKLDT